MTRNIHEKLARRIEARTGSRPALVPLASRAAEGSFDGARDQAVLPETDSGMFRTRRLTATSPDRAQLRCWYADEQIRRIATTLRRQLGAPSSAREVAACFGGEIQRTAADQPVRIQIRRGCLRIQVPAGDERAELEQTVHAVAHLVLHLRSASGDYPPELEYLDSALNRLAFEREEEQAQLFTSAFLGEEPDAIAAA